MLGVEEERFRAAGVKRYREEEVRMRALPVGKIRGGAAVLRSGAERRRTVRRPLLLEGYGGRAN